MTFMKKYAPTTLDDLVFVDEDAKTRVEQYASGKRNGNIVLHGPKGTAKSTTARIIAEARLKDADCDNSYSVYHAKNITESTIDALWNDYHLQRLGGNTEPYVVIEEADQMSKSLQQKLRASLDETDYGHVILTTNHIHNLDEPLVDRCDDIEMPMANTDAWLDAAAEILKAEGQQDGPHSFGDIFIH
jgi:DNA polymerase III delta prime subunit